MSVSRVRGFQIQGVDVVVAASACACFSRSSCSLSSCQRCGWVGVCVCSKKYLHWDHVGESERIVREFVSEIFGAGLTRLAFVGIDGGW